MPPCLLWIGLYFFRLIIFCLLKHVGHSLSSHFQFHKETLGIQGDLWVHNVSCTVDEPSKPTKSCKGPIENWFLWTSNIPCMDGGLKGRKKWYKHTNIVVRMSKSIENFYKNVFEPKREYTWKQDLNRLR